MKISNDMIHFTYVLWHFGTSLIIINIVAIVAFENGTCLLTWIELRSWFLHVLIRLILLGVGVQGWMVIASNWTVSSVILIQCWVILNGHFILGVKFILKGVHVFLWSIGNLLAQLRLILISSQLPCMWLILAFPYLDSKSIIIMIQCTFFSLNFHLWLGGYFLLFSFLFFFLILFVEESEVVWVLLLGAIRLIPFLFEMLVDAGDDAAETVHDSVFVVSWSVFFVVTYALVADISTKDTILLTSTGYLMSWMTRSILLAYAIMVSYCCSCRCQSSCAFCGIVVKPMRHHFWVHIFSLAYLRAVF